MIRLRRFTATLLLLAFVPAAMLAAPCHAMCELSGKAAAAATGLVPTQPDPSAVAQAGTDCPLAEVCAFAAAAYVPATPVVMPASSPASEAGRERAFRVTYFSNPLEHPPKG
jgi:hypothetical protein